MENKRKSSLYLGGLIILLIISTPYLIYLYKFVPTTETWDTIFGTIQSGYYETIDGYIFLSKPSS